MNNRIYALDTKLRLIEYNIGIQINSKLYNYAELRIREGFILRSNCKLLFFFISVCGAEKACLNFILDIVNYSIYDIFPTLQPNKLLTSNSYWRLI